MGCPHGKAKRNCRLCRRGGPAGVKSGPQPARVKPEPQPARAEPERAKPGPEPVRAQPEYAKPDPVQLELDSAFEAWGSAALTQAATECATSAIARQALESEMCMHGHEVKGCFVCAPVLL